MFDKSIYTGRRQKLKQQLGSGLVLLLGNEDSSINFKDNLYPFRQDSSFLYFFGLDRPGLAGIIDIDNDREVLFGRDSSLDDIIWIGQQPSLAMHADGVGVAETQPYDKLGAFLQHTGAKSQAIHFLPPYRPENILKLSAWLGIAPSMLKERSSVGLIRAIVAQRSVKSPEEVVEIEEAADITAAMHLAAIQGAKEGMTEAELAGVLHGIAVSAGGNLSFSTILTVNGQVLHNHYGSHILETGKMVLCDCGAENPLHYAGDMTRTFPVAKKFTSVQKEMYEIVLSSQQAAADALRPGVLFRDIHFLAAEKLVDGLKAAGLMKGDSKEAVAAGAHTLFFQCGLGHMMGLDVHDMEDLGEEYVGYTDELKKSKEFGLKSLRLGRALEAGFVVTIEPGLYFIPELMDLRRSEKKFEAFIDYDRLGSFRDFGGIRIEEDFLITPSGSRLLGKPLPKTVADIEALRG
ncbi:MAG TPA: aminopeptidase P family protein [Puia sp.]|nr:aminopeptidase P family protein [Puia sp.]